MFRRDDFPAFDLPKKGKFWIRVRRELL